MKLQMNGFSGRKGLLPQNLTKAAFKMGETTVDFNVAIQKHAEWKVKFRTAISKQERMDAAAIGKDNCCEFGIWLHGEAKAKYGSLPSLAECITKHAAFHREAGRIATTINSGQFAEAEAMLNAGTSYSAASSEVGVAVMKLKKEVDAKSRAA